MKAMGVNTDRKKCNGTLPMNHASTRPKVFVFYHQMNGSLKCEKDDWIEKSAVFRLFILPIILRMDDIRKLLDHLMGPDRDGERRQGEVDVFASSIRYSA